MNKTVGIIGKGWVGKAMKDLFPEAYVYSDGKSGLFGRKEDINKCDVVFVCVPTPCPSEGRLDTSMVEDAVSWCKAKLIVIRSTVNPGDCYKWSLKYKKHIVFQPEYLGETPQHPLIDTKATPFLIIGGKQPDRRKLIELYTEVYNANVNIRQTDDYTAEVIKLTENRAIAYKVSQIQELYDACEASGTDFYTVRDAVYGDDPRFNLWWTMIYPGKRGFNSKCIPKDIFAWCAWAEGAGIKPLITRTILKQNKKWLRLNK